jgi:hypothetical protein
MPTKGLQISYITHGKCFDTRIVAAADQVISREEELLGLRDRKGLEYA